MIFQQRDDIPGITNPGLVSAFGGSAEQGETPIQAVLREGEEELGLRLTPDDIFLFKQYRKTTEIYGEDSDVYYFVADGIDDSGLIVIEGKGSVLFDPTSSIDIKVTPMLRKFIEDYKAWRKL
jgi:8-oxo-dGTP pyrophosphatase MutT (NUDIX family)